ncbi:MAG TPA: hypothetical protein VE955_00585, partial [Candidatus Dormibacteraeota bacterium]|nr:hypothetical protein [Candidatus Dormibacteraeota bacterium]
GRASLAANRVGLKPLGFSQRFKLPCSPTLSRRISKKIELLIGTNQIGTEYVGVLLASFEEQV